MFFPTRLPAWLRLSTAALIASRCLASPPSAPSRPSARVGDRGVALCWRPAGGAPEGYRVLRASQAAGPYAPVTSDWIRVARFADVTVSNDTPYFYRVEAHNADGVGAPSPEAAATPHAFRSDDEFLELLQATAFDYFWNEANPANGLVKDRSTPGSFSSIAAVGFGLTAAAIGVDHGWITRREGAERTLRTLQTFWNGAQGPESEGRIGFKGWFYHFLDMNAATRFRRVELSSIDTSLFLAGAMDARQYFDGANPEETEIRKLADQIYARIDFRWMTASEASLTMGWTPESGFIKARWIGYNEAKILVLQAMGAPANPLGAGAWDAWTQGYRWETHFGQSYVPFAPLFGHQYSECWVDFHGRADAFLRKRGITYFENSRRATVANRAYCISRAADHPGYGPETWGLTACDGPEGGRYRGYAARGGPPGENDDGTLAPTAAGGSVAFAPEIAIPCLRRLYAAYRTRIWTAYGFCDAFNAEAGWWDPDVLGIDQGPILIMIENHRTGRVWKRFMKNESILRGLRAAGMETTGGGA